MMKILVLLAIVAIGYLLYRSLVIKREPDHESPAAPAAKAESAKQTATVSKPAPVAEKIISAPTNETPPADNLTVEHHDVVQQADIQTEVGQEAECTAVNAQAKATEKAHHLQARAQALQVQDSIPPVPDQIAAQVGGLQETQDPLARHRLYQQIVDLSYRQRSDEPYREAMHLFAPAHIEEFSDIAPLLKAQNGGKLPQVATFKHYASVLTEAEQYDEAIAICEKAREYGLKDGTKSGYVGRIERISKLKAREAN